MAALRGPGIALVAVLLRIEHRATAPHFSRRRSEKSRIVSMLGEWPGYLRGMGNGLFVAHPLAYLATTVVVDVSNREQPKAVGVGTYEVSGGMTDVVVAGDTAYIARDSSGIDALDV